MKEMENRQKKTWMQHRVSFFKSLLFTTGIMGVLIFAVIFFEIPNPNMILIAGLVLCSALFGFHGGIPAAGIMLFYSLYFFSTDHSFFHFTAQNLQKVIVSLVGIVADMVLVCLLKKAELKAFAEANELAEKLNLENDRLLEVSLTDELTGVQNRLALRQAYESYRGKTATVMMLDVDSFKEINDSFGHKEGDRILKEFGAALTQVFGAKYCFRYGGDEFLILHPEMPEEEWQNKLRSLEERRPVLNACGEEKYADFSYGFVTDRMDNKEKMRKMISEADDRMYEQKSQKHSDHPFLRGV